MQYVLNVVTRDLSKINDFEIFYFTVYKQNQRFLAFDSIHLGNFRVFTRFLIKLSCNSDVFGEQKSGSGRVWGLLFGVGSGSGINISGTSPSGFRGFGDF